ncbi:hypothetical protein PENCOP_c011G03217 [Penicillium coprophilum]|uniref:Uncharacterized protein n=1 Tax=Penicillium coprophilum TaxID=36646 RepID=A0A1V6UEK0_9EURO|nr:hypothetical protein PENCOP_c011G03217 [Penicillium coprophilum]
MASRPNAHNAWSPEPPADTAIVVAQPATARTAESVHHIAEETAIEPTGDSISSSDCKSTINITASNHTGDNTVTVTNTNANPITIKNMVHITVTNIGNRVTTTGEAITPVCSHTSTSSKGEATQSTVSKTGQVSKLPDSSHEESTKPSASSNLRNNSETTYHRCDDLVSRTVNLHSPYVSGTPDPALTQVWIDHIDHMLGVRTDHQTQDMQRCIEQTDRVVNLANSIFAQATEMLEDQRRINRGEYIHDDSDNDSSSTSDEPRDSAEKSGVKKMISGSGGR